MQRRANFLKFSSKVFNFFCIQRFREITEKALSYEEKYEEGLSKIAIDTKPLSGKAILSTNERTIDHTLGAPTYVVARSTKAKEDLEKKGVPFYSAFTSGRAVSDLLLDKRDKYQLPQSFDEIDNIAPSISPRSPLADQVNPCNKKIRKS